MTIPMNFYHRSNTCTNHSSEKDESIANKLPWPILEALLEFPQVLFIGSIKKRTPYRVDLSRFFNPCAFIRDPSPHSKDAVSLP